jgi:tetratricopeptide (TPR) repeat protein
VSSSIGYTNDVLREHSAGRVLASELDGIVAAIERGDGTAAASELHALASTTLARARTRDDENGPYLDLVARALDLAMPTGQRIALLSLRGRSLGRRGDVAAADRDYREACVLANKAGFRREEARLIGELGMSAYSQCDFAAAMAHFQSALVIQVVLGDAAEQAVTLTQLALVHREQGSMEDARDTASRALSIHRTTGSSTHEAATLVELARCDLDEGDLVRARSRILSALDLARAKERPALAVYARFIAATIEYASGNSDFAEREWIAVIHASREASQHAGLPYALLRLEGGSFAYLGLHAFDRGDVATAAERFEQALSILLHSGGFRHAALVKGYLAACARRDGDEERATMLFAESRAMVVPSDRMRVAVDIIEATLEALPLSPSALESATSAWESRHALERYERSVGSVAPEPIETDCVFQVAMDGAWMEHEGHHVSCNRRLATQRLLATLARARSETPGEPVPIDRLITAGWPNEDVPPAAGKNRLRVALSWLRKHGLGRALCSRADGYLLDPDAVAVTLTEPRVLSDARRRPS